MPSVVGISATDVAVFDLVLGGSASVC